MLRLSDSRTSRDREMGMRKMKPGGLWEGQNRGREAGRLSQGGSKHRPGREDRTSQGLPSNLD